MRLRHIISTLTIATLPMGAMAQGLSSGLNPADMDNVKKIQAGYKLQPLSTFLGKPAPPAAPAINWPKLTPEMFTTGFAEYLDFLLQFAPPTGTAAVEKPMRDKFAAIRFMQSLKAARFQLPHGSNDITVSAGHSYKPTALTVSYSAASSPASPHAAIQLADSLTRGSSIGADSRLVIASATAMRPDAGALMAASGVRSPIAIASPAKPA